MAEAFPDTLVNIPNVTPGEERVFDILKNVLHDEEFIVWYEPKIESKTGRVLHPDFIVWGHMIGLIIIEVKDWVIKDIVSGDTKSIKIKKGDKIVTLSNPENQVREYVNNTMNSLAKIKNFIHSEGSYKGRLKFPVGHGIILTNINKSEFENFKLEEIITKDIVLFSDDLDKLESGGNDIILTSKLRKMGKHFSFDNLSLKELDKLRAVLFPEIVIPEISTGKEKSIEKSNATLLEKIDDGQIKILDKKQESLATKVGSGHRIIKGVAGSGKTLMIAYRARLLKMLHPKWKILIICYNITLRNYIRELINNLLTDTGVNSNDIEIYHFHDFVYNKVGLPQIKKYLDAETKKKIYNTNNDWQYYQGQIGSILMKHLNKINEGQYDAILIDECQDLVTDFIKYLVHLLNKKTNQLLIAVDPAQNIYGGKISWKSVGVEAKGRVTTLDVSYRNTNEILVLALKFNNEKIEKLSKDDSELPLFPDKSDRHGPSPIIKDFENNDHLIDYIVSQIKEIKKVQGYKNNDFGILFPFKLNNDTFQKLESRLKEEEIDYDNISSKEDRLNYKVNNDACKIINIYNVKGYEFKVVFLLNIENFFSNKKDEKQKRNIIYVGITRAMNILEIVYVKNRPETGFIKEIKEIVEDSSKQKL